MFPKSRSSRLLTPDPDRHDYSTLAPHAPQTPQAPHGTYTPYTPSSRSASDTPEPHVRESKRKEPPNSLNLDTYYSVYSHKRPKTLVETIEAIPLPILRVDVPKDECIGMNDYRLQVCERIRQYEDNQMRQEWKTAWELIARHGNYKYNPFPVASPQNTMYKETKVNLKDLKPWAGFPTFKDIHEFSTNLLNLEINFHERKVQAGDDLLWFERYFNSPTTPRGHEENNLVELLAALFSQLNGFIRLACNGLGYSNSWITINGGKCAKLRRIGGNCENKIPDRVAFWTDGESSQISPGVSVSDPTKVPCLLVGDFKLANKFNSNMLNPGNRNTETGKVMNQIHDYMDMHHNRFGYVITELELIMFRRRDENGMWGLLDYSPSIPLAIEEGHLNALMVLWYFHVKYALLGEDEGYKLLSFYNKCPHELGGDVFPNTTPPRKGRNKRDKGAKGKSSIL